MTTMTKEEVESALRPYHDRIKHVVQEAYDEWRAVNDFRLKGGYGTIMYSRTVANFVFDAIARSAAATFNGDKSVRIHHETQTVKFIFENKVIARFKKGDDDHPGQNIPTQAILDYLDPQQTLPGLPPEAAKVEIMWKANDIGTEIDEVTVASRDGKHITWSYKIDDIGEEGSTGVLDFPVGPAPDEFSPLVVVKPRKTERESK
jgi:hypothetical protein